jgi:hypothetical protein
MNSMDRFERFIGSSDLPVYVATDDEDVKNSFRERYPGKVLAMDCPLSRSSHEALVSSMQEIAICIEAEEFLGSRGSSFSSLISAYRGCGRPELLPEQEEASVMSDQDSKYEH